MDRTAFLEAVKDDGKFEIELKEGVVLTLQKPSQLDIINMGGDLFINQEFLSQFTQESLSESDDTEKQERGISLISKFAPKIPELFENLVVGGIKWDDVPRCYHMQIMLAILNNLTGETTTTSENLKNG
jgi:hypothetical protein